MTHTPCTTCHPSSQSTPSSSSFSFQATLSCRRHPWYRWRCSPHLLQDGRSSRFLPAPDAWPPPAPPVPLALPAPSAPPPELDTLPLPMPPLHAPSVLPPPATSGPGPIEVPPPSSSAPR